MKIETKRLVLRPWREDDAVKLFELAGDPGVGPAAGWPSHRSVDESREIIRTVFAAPDTYAICLRDTGEPVGSIGLMPPRCGAECLDGALELEIGYWVGKPFWGQGLATEAVCALECYAFEALGCRALWCGYYEGNERSHRVMEKCGFMPHHVEKGVSVDLLGKIATEHFMRLTREDYLADFSLCVSVNFG